MSTWHYDDKESQGILKNVSRWGPSIHIYTPLYMKTQRCQQSHILDTKVVPPLPVLMLHLHQKHLYTGPCLQQIPACKHRNAFWQNIALKYNFFIFFFKSQFESGTLLYLEVSQSCFGQRDIFHQKAAVFHWYIRRVQDVDLSCENGSRAWKITVSSIFSIPSIFP